MDGPHGLLAAGAARAGAAAGDALLLLDAGRWRPVMADLLPVVDVAVCCGDFLVAGVVDSAGTAAAAAGR